jgi:tRNA (cytidine/uridine-2'-O-)-methyltransferase
LVLLTTQGDMPYADFAFAAEDTLLVGRESGGVPLEVHDAAEARLVIPMQAGLRSLNVAMAAAMVAGEALRQTGGPTGNVS